MTKKKIMPELPEVETIKLQLNSVLVGKTIKEVEVRKTKLFGGEISKIRGRRVIGIRRFSKLLIIDLSGGLSLAIHLKMTGRLVFNSPEYEQDKQTHIVVQFTDRSKLYFHDQRQFGYIQVVPSDKVGNLGYISNLGKEFLKDLTNQDFAKVLKKSSLPIKVVLMDQTKFAGVGNIYANEALWIAKINPKAQANTLSRNLASSLFASLEKILKQAIKWGGASDNNYRDAFGNKGKVQEHFLVYNQAGLPCQRCKTKIQKISLGGRGTYFCPNCQKLGS